MRTDADDIRSHVRRSFTVAGVLAVLCLSAVGLTYAVNGSGRVGLIVLIALAQAGLIGGILMHLTRERGPIIRVTAFTLFLLAAILGLITCARTDLRPGVEARGEFAPAPPAEAGAERGH